MLQQKSKYFITILPPLVIQEEINIFQQQILKKFNCKSSLNAPPHLTLIMPFLWKNTKEKVLFDLVNQINNSFESIDIQLDDFGFFEPKTIFIKVKKEAKLMHFQAKLLNNIRKELKIPHTNYKNGAFHPHITIGARGLKKSDFYVVKEIYKDKKYSKNFVINEIYLFRKNGNNWEKVLTAQF